MPSAWSIKTSEPNVRIFQKSGHDDRGSRHLKVGVYISANTVVSDDDKGQHIGNMNAFPNRLGPGTYMTVTVNGCAPEHRQSYAAAVRAFVGFLACAHWDGPYVADIDQAEDLLDASDFVVMDGEPYGIGHVIMAYMPPDQRSMSVEQLNF